jgi:hypothetical protein
LVYADDVNLLGDSVDTIKKNTQTLIDDSKEVGLEVNTDKSKYMLLPRHKNAGQNHDIKITNSCFENMAKFKYFRTAVTNKNLIQGEIKRTLNSGNACYFQSRTFCPLVCCLKHRNQNIENYNFICGSAWV